MSIKAKLKPYLKDTLLWKAADWVKSSLVNYTLIVASFILGRCSYSKMKAFIHEWHRQRRNLSARSKGKDFIVSTYNGKKILTTDEANKLVSEAIETNTPFMVGRYGSIELNAAWRVGEDGKSFTFPVGRAMKSLCHNPGFFPYSKEALLKFGSLMRQATSQVNLMGVWFNPMEEWMLRTYGTNPEYCNLGSIEPFFSSCPWSAALEGKKVLVIHPFDKTIQAQYKKRELLFPGKNILPEFELITQRAVQTIAGNRDERFAAWFDALDYMYDEAMKKDFDVAIIGCGAYGFPLAAKIKKAGKIAVHMGGSTQILFGIKGKRWELFGSKWAKLLDNPAWVRPEEKPKGSETIEDGCYW